jgi:hypothetical protein
VVGIEIGREEHGRLRRKAWFWGGFAGLGLVGIYLGTLWVANSLHHALEEFFRLWPFMVPLILGFSFQVAIFAYVHGATRNMQHGPKGTGIAASGGGSVTAMVACCAHHLTDVLPLLGLAGAATFLSVAQSFFLWIGIIANAVGLVYVAGIVSRHQIRPKGFSFVGLLTQVPFHKAFRWVLLAGGLLSVILLIMEILS